MLFATSQVFSIGPKSNMLSATHSDMAITKSGRCCGCWDQPHRLQSEHFLPLPAAMAKHLRTHSRSLLMVV